VLAFVWLVVAWVASAGSAAPSVVDGPYGGTPSTLTVDVVNGAILDVDWLYSGVCGDGLVSLLLDPARQTALQPPVPVVPGQPFTIDQSTPPGAANRGDSLGGTLTVTGKMLNAYTMEGHITWVEMTSVGGTCTGDSDFDLTTSPPTVVFYSARGSSEKFSSADPAGLGAPALALWTDLKKSMDAAGETLVTMGDPYPAVDIFDAFTADQAQHKPLGTHYRESAAEGLSDGVRELTEIASEQDAIGPNWKLVLIGYSQGADVMRQIMAALPAAVVSHIAAAVLFGDPYFEAHEANVMAFGGIRPNIGEFQPHAIGVARFAAGVGQAPQPQPLRVPTYSWCNDHDLVCGLNVSLGRLLPRSMASSVTLSGGRSLALS